MLLQSRIHSTDTFATTAIDLVGAHDNVAHELGGNI